MRRWTLNLLCALSLLIFIASIALWIRTYVYWESTQWRSSSIDTTGWPPWVHDVTYGLRWANGIVSIDRFRSDHLGSFAGPSGREYHCVIPGGPPSYLLYAATSAGDRVFIRFHSFQLAHSVNLIQHGSGWASAQQIVFPAWLFLPAAIPPLLWTRRYRRNRRRGFPVEATTS